jgi:abortive infection bacteriophage resistance protein
MAISDLALRLRTRGLIDSNSELNSALLTHGYFRLSGYWRYFQIDPAGGNNAFHPGSDLADILAIYYLDAHLRNLLLEGVAEVEIALRASLVANLCVPGGCGTEYQSESTYVARIASSGEDLRARLLSDIRQDIERSKERHIVHHRQSGVTTVPLWVSIEAMSFGEVSRMYGLLSDESQQKAVAKRFDYRDGLFSSFGSNLRAVTSIRNICAHHSRLWNRTLHQDAPKLFAGAFSPGVTRSQYAKSPWGAIAVLGHMVKQIRRNDSFMVDVDTLVTKNSAYWSGIAHPDPR